VLSLLVLLLVIRNYPKVQLQSIKKLLQRNDNFLASSGTFLTTWSVLPDSKGMQEYQRKLMYKEGVVPRCFRALKKVAG